MKIFEAAELLKNNKISPVELWRYVQKNINEKNSLNRAYITLCNGEENALRVQNSRTDSPLWGIPVAIKDNICTKSIRTTAASKMLESFVPPYNATVVDKLLGCGVVITGKTNMDEFGMGAEGKFSAYGQTTNPINELFVPGGSSGGSGVSVKSNMALGALGTDTGGSIRQPAAFCGVYGLKPSYSLVSRYGLIAFASSLDVIGPMAKSAKDCAMLLDAIAGEDSRDATCSKKAKESYTDNLTENIKGLRVGVPGEYAAYGTAAVKAAIKTAAENFRTLGCKVEECSLKSLRYAEGAYYVISSSEASSNLARYDGVRFTKRCNDYNSLEEMYQNTRSQFFGDEVKSRILFGTRVLSEGYYDKYYLRANMARRLITQELNALFEKFDIIITPVSNSDVWKIGEEKPFDEVYANDGWTALVSLAGCCGISVPVLTDANGLPTGIQIVGKRFAEQTILNAAWAYEKGGFYNGI